VNLTRALKCLNISCIFGVYVRSLHLGQISCQVLYDPSSSGGGPSLVVEVVDCRCVMLFDDDIEVCIREAAGDGIMEEGFNNEERVLDGEGEGGVVGRIGNVIGNVFRKAVESAVEGGVRGDDDLLN
jgi:hypothetical protein